MISVQIYDKECATIAIGLRLVCLCLSLIGIFHVRVAACAKQSSLASSLDYCVDMLFHWLCHLCHSSSFLPHSLSEEVVYVLFNASCLVISFLFLLQELGFNVVTLLLSLIFALTRSSWTDLSRAFWASFPVSVSSRSGCFDSPSSTALFVGKKQGHVDKGYKSSPFKPQPWNGEVSG